MHGHHGHHGGHHRGPGFGPPPMHHRPPWAVCIITPIITWADGTPPIETPAAAAAFSPS